MEGFPVPRYRVKREDVASRQHQREPTFCAGSPRMSARKERRAGIFASDISNAVNWTAHVIPMTNVKDARFFCY